MANANTNNTVLIGCKLPHGIILHHPLNPDAKVKIDGLNKCKIIGSTYATTRIDAAFFRDWYEMHKTFAPIKSGAIFVANDDASLEAKAKEYVERKTGLEPMKQDAHGVKPADKKD